MRTIKRKTKIYSVDWYHGDHCYRTTMGCKWSEVLDCKRAAKLMGETIKYEHYDTIVDEYKVYGNRGGLPRFMTR